MSVVGYCYRWLCEECYTELEEKGRAPKAKTIANGTAEICYWCRERVGVHQCDLAVLFRSLE